MHILIVSITSYKNVLLTIPLLQALKNKFPDCSLHYVSSINHAHYLQKVPLICENYFINGDAIPTIFNLLKVNFTYVIDLEETFRASLIINSLKSKYNQNATFYQYPNGLFAKLFNRKKAFQHKSLSLKFIEACKGLNLSSSNTTLKYFTTQADNLKKDDIPTSHSAGYICLNLENLKVPQAALESFCSNLKFPVILCGAKANFVEAEKLKALDAIKIYNACGKYTEAEMYKVFLGSKVNISALCINVYTMAATQKPLLFIDDKQPSLFNLEPYTGFSGNMFKQNNNALAIEDVQKWISS